MKGRIIGIISIKGGVGKTTTVSNLGAVLVKEFGKRVLLVDANYSGPNLCYHLGVENPERTISEVLEDKISITEAIFEHNLGFHIIPAKLTHGDVNPFKLKQKITSLKNYYDIILIDSSPNMNNEILSTLIASDEIAVVTSPDIPTLSNTLYAIKIAKEKNTPIFGIILNKVRRKNFEIRLEEIEEATNTPVIAVLPDDVNILEALSQTVPSTIHKPDADTSIEYKKLAACLLGKDYDDQRFISKIKNFFFRSMPKHEINRCVAKELRSKKENPEKENNVSNNITKIEFPIKEKGLT
jgi:septum site-determining protein MinD